MGLGPEKAKAWVWSQIVELEKEVKVKEIVTISSMGQEEIGEAEGCKTEAERQCEFLKSNKTIKVLRPEWAA